MSVAAVIVGGAAFIGGAFIAPPSGAYDVERPNASVGYFDVLRQRDPAVELGVGYRWERTGWAIRPLAAVSATSDRTILVSAGVAYDLPIGQRLVLTPSFMPGLYSHGRGLDLGYPLEFRSSLQMAYRFHSGSRFGVSISHTSNAHLGAQNPGEESLMLSYSFTRPSKIAPTER
jgi:hypothetical protein